MQSTYDQSSMPSQYDYYRQLNESSRHLTQYQMSPYEQLLLQQQQQQQLLQQQGFEGLYNYDLMAEDTEWFLNDTTQMEQEMEGRLADTALFSWGLDGNQVKKLGSRLSMSGRSSFNIDLKTFLAQKGKKNLVGLHKAASKNDVGSIMNIIKREGPNAPLDTADENGCTPLMYAAMTDSVAAIEMLLNFSVKREQTDDAGRTAVHYATFYGKAKALKVLIESGSHWCPKDSYGRTPLHWASTTSNTKCLSILLNHASIVNGNINPKDNEQMTPVHCAAQYNAAKHITIMNEADCDFVAVDIEGKTALHWTTGNSNPSCLYSIVNYYPHLLNKQDANGHTILHLTACTGNVILVEALLNIEGIEIDARDKQDRTPIHLCCIEGHSNILQLLLLYKALDACIDTTGLTALHYAVAISSVPCVQLLVSSGYTTHVPSADERSVTPLMMAAENSFSDVLMALLSNTEIVEEINQCDPNGTSALHYASLVGSPECISALIEYGADPNLLDKRKISPLSLVCEKGYHLCVEPLIVGGAAAHFIDGDGYTALHKAVLYRHLEVAKSLLDTNCYTDVFDDNGQTPLQLAVYGGAEEMVLLLLQSSSNPNIMDANGLTAVHIATIEGHIEILTLILDNGGYVNNMDGTENRYTPLDYAQQANNTDCIEVLYQYGAASINDINTIAAICIQSAYRKYKAKIMLGVLKQQNVAAICIQRYVRGLLQRRKYQNLCKQQNASIKIQAVVRGFLARQRYSRCLRQFREEERQQQLITDFGHMILSFQESLLQPITIETEVLEAKQEKSDSEWQARVEMCLKLRDHHQKHQEEWKRFRLAEKQRRIDKEYQERQAYLMNIISDSQARRRYFQDKFFYTNSVRSCHEAAATIQRAYRQARQRRETKRRKIEMEARKKLAQQRWAACLIQRSWRRYKEWKNFERQNLRSIVTNPVICLPPLLPSQQISQFRSYERGTIVSGTGRRQLHKTQQSGFKIFKPITTSSHSRHLSHLQAHSHKVYTKSYLKDSPRMKAMQDNWPWVHDIIWSPHDEVRQSVLPALQTTSNCHSNKSTTITTTPLKLPQLLNN